MSPALMESLRLIDSMSDEDIDKLCNVKKISDEVAVIAGTVRCRRIPPVPLTHTHCSHFHTYARGCISLLPTILSAS